jgi:uncharacterized phage protein (TIGR01671 family)
MMRERKFRGKRTYDGSWVYGDLVEKRYINSGMDKEGTSVIESRENGTFTCYEVDKKTVGDFTGLLDKNKVEIYEGDICEHYGLIYKVEWDTGLWAIKGINERMNPDGEYIKVRDDMLYNEYKVLEVIGNIYEGAKYSYTVTKPIP